MTRTSMVPIVSLLAVCLGSLAACSSPAPEDAGEKTAMSIKPSEDLTEEALAILNEKCEVCHTAERFEKTAFTAEQWNDVLERMVAKGARLSGDELDVLRHWRGSE